MTASSRRPIRKPNCSAASIASTACPAPPSRHAIIAAPTALSPIEAGWGPETMTTMTSHMRRRVGRTTAILIGLGLSLGGCMHDGLVATAKNFPDDYRLRHPIAVEEANHSIVIFVGQGRGGLSAEQRAD